MLAKNVLLAFSGLNKLRNVAAEPNAFSSPLSDTIIHAGQIMEITWIESSGSTVDLYLVGGDPSDLSTSETVATNVPNQGSVVWTVPTTTAPGKYALRINSENGLTNYSPFFTVLDPVSPINFGVGSHKVVKAGGRIL